MAQGQEYEKDSNAVIFEDAKCKHATDVAILVSIDGDDYWVPSSMVHDDSEVFEKGHEGNLIITKWIAKKLDLWED